MKIVPQDIFMLQRGKEVEVGAELNTVTDRV
jgi:hypothetical protein